MKYRNGRDASIGDSVICLVPGTGVGTVGEINGDVVRILTYQEIKRGGPFTATPLEASGRLFEPVFSSAVAADCLHLEDCAAAADVEQLRDVNSKLVETNAVQSNVLVEREDQLRKALDEIAGLKAALMAEQKPAEDKATLSLFPQETVPGPAPTPAPSASPLADAIATQQMSQRDVPTQ